MKLNPSKHVLFVIFSVVLSQTAFSQTCELCKYTKHLTSTSPAPSRLTEEVYRDHFFNEYEERKCSKNIYHFLDSVRWARDFDITKAHVLYIFTSPSAKVEAQRDFMFEPKESRNDNSSWWYHVVLEYDHKIFDFDHSHLPQIAGLHRYFESMFGAGWDKQRLAYHEFVKGHADESDENEEEEESGETAFPLFVREIPALFYLHNYTVWGYSEMNDDNKHGFKWYPDEWLRQRHAQTFKTKTLREFLFETSILNQ